SSFFCSLALLFVKRIERYYKSSGRPLFLRRKNLDPLSLNDLARVSQLAFTELQAKVIDTQQKVKLADIQIEQLNRTKKHAHLTDTEIMTLVDETHMYEGVGRMFILQSKEAIHNQLLEKQKIAEEKIKELEQRKSYLERSVKDAEDNIREMLMARRAQ
uniref:Prefoldin subunit 1 n=1 Tax=Sarcophilus harrisii TaxID=9305 RepID=G3WS10_SARHA